VEGAADGREAWNFRSAAGYTEGLELTGYKVIASDGEVGKVDRATYDPDSSSLVVDTGPWILGSQVLLPVVVPAAVIERIDPEQETVYVDRLKEQIKDGPPYDPDVDVGPRFWQQVSRHYGFAP